VQVEEFAAVEGITDEDIIKGGTDEINGTLIYIKIKVVS